MDCHFTATMASDGAGDLVATVTDAAGLQSESAPAPFGWEGAEATSAPDAAECAEAFTVGASQAGRQSSPCARLRPLVV